MSPRKSTASRKKKEQARSACPIASALERIGDKWTLLVVRDLSLGCKRYGDFLASPEGYPTNILADRLKRLEAAGLIDRVLYSKRPPRAEYFLNEKGKSLTPILAQLSAWGLTHIPGTSVWERPADPEESPDPAPVAAAPQVEAAPAVALAPAETEVASDVVEAGGPAVAEAESPIEPEAADVESPAEQEHRDTEEAPAYAVPGSGNGHSAPEPEPAGSPLEEDAADEAVPVAAIDDAEAPSGDPQDQMSLW